MRTSWLVAITLVAITLGAILLAGTLGPALADDKVKEKPTRSKGKKSRKSFF
jgi:hypothetical protein